MKTIAILGCGNIGTIVAQRLADAEVVAVYDQLPERRTTLAALCGAASCASFTELLSHKFDLLIEAASPEAVRAHAAEAIQARRTLVVLSTGALTDPDFRHQLEQQALAHGVNLHIPSGAVMGLDNLKIGRISRLSRFLLRTTKPPAALGVEVKEPTCLFQGKASDCIVQYPRNINVAISLSLAAGRECEVEIWADPAAGANRHQIFAEGEFGRVEITVENQPSPDNPRTSYLAALSVLALIDNFDRPIKVGC